MTSSTLITPSIEQPQALQTTLPNGLTIIAVENSVADIISTRIFVKAGQFCETAETAGLFDLLTAVLMKGTEQKTALQIAEAVESIGASFGADVASDYSLLSLKTVSADFEKILALAAEVLRTPSFPEAEVELERKLILQGLKSMKEQPFGMAYNYLREAMFVGHPYGIPLAQTQQQVAKFTRSDICQAHTTYFRPDNMVMTVVGRISPKLVVKLAEQYFGDWVKPDVPLEEITFPDIPVAARKIVTPQQTNQAFVVVGYLADSVSGADYAALKLISTYLGNGLSSRLFVELREKQGLAYDVSAFYLTRLEQSQFVAYIGTAPQNISIALKGLQHELERMKTTPLTAEALQVSKNKILGQYALSKQTNGQIAQTYGWYETIGLGMEFDERFPALINAVTIEDIQAAACRCFTEQSVSILGPADRVADFM
ncbi:MAG: pitrilysin family protein [Cyanobacteria bacterium P01_D01_bin.105]